MPPALRATAPPKRKTVSADIVVDTVPIGGVVYALSDTPATGLRKFDLGNVPASVTPPRSWRRAAWFAVGTSAAVVLGLTVATAELMGTAVEDGALIDALPAYPSGPLTLGRLPNELTTDGTATHDLPKTSGRPPSVSRPAATPAPREAPPRDTVVGSTTGDTYLPGPTSEEEVETTTTPSTSSAPNRRTVGPEPVTPTDPQVMGDRTEQYFRLVTTDPAAAHAMTAGSMAREGTEGIANRYAGVERVEVQDMTIDRNKAVTTVTVKLVRKDGTEAVETRQLSFTWGSDPKITEDAVTA